LVSEDFGGIMRSVGSHPILHLTELQSGPGECYKDAAPKGAHFG
jgi:hypothetical protein